ncbi:hypothetical protein D770_21910 [Flammeovirgaceae bacterium 311]|nr:hypothetical protein D770_21910 [Flammeovirgaceae bacterium 311]
MTPPFAAPSPSRVSTIHEYYKVIAQGPLEEHFMEFIDSLPEGHRSYYLQQGFQASQQNVLFRRFIQERVGQRLYMIQDQSLAVVEESAAKEDSPIWIYSNKALLYKYNAVLVDSLVKVFISLGQIHVWMSSCLT